jgi:Recombinase
MSPAAIEQRTVVRPAEHVVRLAYTRSQAAEALGISRSTFIRRVLPDVETVRMPWGTQLIPGDELERLLAEGRRPAKPRPEPARRGRPQALPNDVVERIATAHASGRSLGDIARELNADGVPTAQGGRQWWPSTVRVVLNRSGREETLAHPAALPPDAAARA